MADAAPLQRPVSTSVKHRKVGEIQRRPARRKFVR
jgi:hypothetical protein